MNAARLLFFIGLLIAQTAGSQIPESHFVQYSTTDGLSHNNTNSITQDPRGYMWITTPAGLNRFNGQQFVQFHSSNDSLSPASENLTGTVWLNKDLLAIYTTGLHIINSRTNERHNLFIPYHRPQLQYKFNMIERAMGDEAGNIYVLSRSGFYHFDKNYQLVSRFDYYSEAEVPIAHFYFGRDLFALDENRLLIVSIAGLYVYDKPTKKLSKMTAADSPLLSGFLHYPGEFYSFFQPGPGKLVVLKAWSDSMFYINLRENKKLVSRMPFNPGKMLFHWRSRLVAVTDSLFYITGHQAGFYKLRLQAGTGQLLLDPAINFEAYQCNGLFQDRSGQLWIATNNGLFRQDEGRSQVALAVMPASVQQPYPNSTFNEVFVSGDQLYAGTWYPGNLLVYDKNTLAFTRIADLDRFRKKREQNLNIYSIEMMDPATLLLATNGPLLKTNRDATRLEEIYPPQWDNDIDWTKDLFKDSRDNTWISSTLVYRYSPAAKNFDFIPAEQQALSQLREPELTREDGDGNLWMAGHGLTRYNRSTGRYDLRLDSFPYIKMPDKQVNAMVIDRSRNIIWFNSTNNGLIGYEINRRKFHHFTTRDGLPDNNITALSIVRNTLWMAGLSKLASMDLSNFQVTGFSNEDGLPAMPVGARANFFYDSVSQQLYVPFSRAIARFNPDHLLRKKTPPQVFIEELKLNDQENIFLPQNAVTTTWKENSLHLVIGSINYSNAGSQHFAYRIVKDQSTPWIDLGSQPGFSISSLSPGRHHIQVKAYSGTNRWPEQVADLQVEVLPPFWKTPWFLFLAAIILLALIYGIIQWRTRVARHKEMEKTHIEKLKADDYKAQFELEQITNYFSSSMAGKKTEEDVLWDVTANLIGRMNYEDCVIYLWNGDKTRMVQKAAYGPKGKPEVISKDAFEVAPGEGIVGHVIKTRQPILVKDTRFDSRYRVDDEFRLSEVAVPIIYNDELLGVIDSENRQLGYFSERDIKMLTTIATLTGNKLKEIVSQQSLEAKQQELAGINEQLAEARLSALQAQMNPHFVFNALNSIKRMILDCDNEKASRYLSKFALMIRMTLEHSKELFVTLDENIEYLEAYLEMERLRFDDSFTYSICVEDTVDITETQLPSMMIQPLVENAIWHGLLQAGPGKRLQVHFSEADNYIICKVEDNGIGIHRSEILRAQHRPLHLPVGLQNLQNRIKIMNEKYGTDCSLEITDLSDTDPNRHGTSAVLRLKLINS